MQAKRSTLLLLACLCTLQPKVLAQQVRSHIEVDVVASIVPSQEYECASRRSERSVVNNKVIFRSDYGGAYVEHVRTNGINVLTVVSGGKKSQPIELAGQIGALHWRPKHAAFLYTAFDESSGGDFGKSSLHYVEVGSGVVLNEGITIKDMPDTDFAWSSDGRYVVFSFYSQLKVLEFDTGKTWVTNTIRKSDGSVVKPGTHVQFGGFCWRDADRAVLFYWKNHPFDDMAAGYLRVAISFIDADPR